MLSGWAHTPSLVKTEQQIAHRLSDCDRDIKMADMSPSLAAELVHSLSLP
jgi:hypothetical protein